MIYHGTSKIENIIVHPYNDEKNHQVVSLIQYPDAPIFDVEVDDGEDVWIWEFVMDSVSDYERVKLNIMETIFEVDDMRVLAEILDEIFEDGFADILLADDCDGDCENCPKRDGE